MSTQEVPTPDVLIGVIGGSGLYHLDNLTFVKTVNPETPWGFPSSPITISRLPSGAHIAFVARHGSGHTIPPSAIPVRANISALKSLGARSILAFSAVGSLREELPPGAFIIPDQIIDRTKGIRPTTFFDVDTEVVAHASFADPFSVKLGEWVAGAVEKALIKEGRGVIFKKGGTIICMEGPQFSTRAESLLYRSWGADIIGMTQLPESKLAREAELGYALVSTSTDYDAWRPHTAGVTAAEVGETLKANADTSRFVVATILEELVETIKRDGEGIITEEKGSMKFSIMPRPGKISDASKNKLAYVLPEYFS